jgi:hypothetical protein
MAEQTSRELVVELILENSKLKSSLAEAEQNMGKSQNKIGALIDKIKKSWLAVSVAIGGVILVTKKLITEYANQEKAELKLQQALKNTGELTKENMDSFKRFANEMQKQVNVADDVVLGMATVGKQMKLTNAQTEQAIKGAIGLNEVFGIGLEQAMRASSSALQGNIGRLGMYIPQLQDVESESEKVRIVTEAMSNGFNIAQESTKGTSGSIEQMRLQFSDFQEELGKVIATVLVPIVRIMSSMLSAFNEASPVIKGVGSALIVVAGAFFTASAGAKALGFALSLMNLNPIILLLTGLALATVGVATGLKKLEENAQSASAKLREYESVNKTILEQEKALKIERDNLQGLSEAEKKAREKWISDAERQIKLNKDRSKLLKEEYEARLKLENAGADEIKTLTNLQGTLKTTAKDTEKLTKEQERLANEINTLVSGAENIEQEKAIQKRIQAIKDFMAKEKKLTKDHYAKLKSAKENFEDQLGEIQKAKKREKMEETFSMVESLENGLTNIVSGVMNNREIEAQNRQTKELNELEKQYENKTITEEEYQAKKSEIEKRFQKESAERARKQAIFDKTSAIVKTIIETAKGVATALGALNIPLATALGVMGAIQTGVIASQPLPEVPTFARGGMVSGLNSPFSGEDGMVGLRNGESVLNQSATAVLGKDAIEALNSGRGINAGGVTINVNSNNGQEVVNVLNGYFRQFGTSARGVAV